jgi:hypothetical protein
MARVTRGDRPLPMPSLFAVGCFLLSSPPEQTPVAGMRIVEKDEDEQTVEIQSMLLVLEAAVHLIQQGGTTWDNSEARGNGRWSERWIQKMAVELEEKEPTPKAAIQLPRRPALPSSVPPSP